MPWCSVFMIWRVGSQCPARRSALRRLAWSVGKPLAAPSLRLTSALTKKVGPRASSSRALQPGCVQPSQNVILERKKYYRSTGTGSIREKMFGSSSRARNKNQNKQKKNEMCGRDHPSAQNLNGM